MWWGRGALEHPWVHRGPQSRGWTLSAPLRLCPGAAGGHWAAAEPSLLAWEPRAPLSGGAEQPLLMAGDGAGSSSPFPPGGFQPPLQLLRSPRAAAALCFHSPGRSGRGLDTGASGAGGLGWFVPGSPCPAPGDRWNLALAGDAPADQQTFLPVFFLFTPPRYPPPRLRPSLSVSLPHHHLSWLSELPSGTSPAAAEHGAQNAAGGGSVIKKRA